MWQERQTRRRFLACLPAAALLAIDARRGGAVQAPAARTKNAGDPEHPEPRPGIDASHVVPRSRLHGEREVIQTFDMVRQMPQIVDGIRCHCGCAEVPEFRSLLSCFERDGMAQHCAICQGQARLAFTLFGQRKSLNEIRAAIDEKFG